MAASAAAKLTPLKQNTTLFQTLKASSPSTLLQNVTPTAGKSTPPKAYRATPAATTKASSPWSTILSPSTPPTQQKSSSPAQALAA